MWPVTSFILVRLNNNQKGLQSCFSFLVLWHQLLLFFSYSFWVIFLQHWHLTGHCHGQTTSPLYLLNLVLSLSIIIILVAFTVIPCYIKFFYLATLLRHLSYQILTYASLPKESSISMAWCLCCCAQTTGTEESPRVMKTHHYHSFCPTPTWHPVVHRSLWCISPINVEVQFMEWHPMQTTANVM